MSDQARFAVESVRDQFPALKQRQVFLDNAGGSQTLGTVINSIAEYLSKTSVQLGGSYAISQQSTTAYTEGYEAAARYINASRDEIVLGASTTQLLHNLSFALKLQPGDELVLSGIDHEANIAAWVDLAARQNLTVKWWRPSELSTNPKLRPEDLKALLSEKTRLVTCTHVSNILGSIHDIKEIAKVVHEVPGAMIIVDGVSYAPHRPIDVKDLGVDFYVFSWYKVYGPHIAMLYGSESAQKNVIPLGHYFNPSKTLEDKLGLAASNYELTQSVKHVVSYFGTTPDASWAAIEAHEQTMQKILLQYLTSRNDINIYGDPSADSKTRVPTVSFVVKGWNPRKVVEALETKTDFGLKWGKFYSNRLIDDVLKLGEEGVVRVSLVHYNTVEEIEAFVKSFDEIIPART